MPDIKPTRSELIKLRKKIKLAETGHDLLKKKKDGLVQEFFRILKDVREYRANLIKSYVAAIAKLETARAMDGSAAVESIAFSLKGEPCVELEVRNIMGVSVPKIEASFVRRELLGRGYGVVGSSSYLDTAIESWENVLEKLIESVEQETVLKKLLLEIEKTKRRVGALEFIVIPNMEDSAGFIEFRLEELERENLFRMKRIKKKREQAGIGL